MGLRGPQPNKKITVLNQVKAKRPKPLPGMTSTARAIWKRAVDAYPPDHFKPQQYDLLMAYCEAGALHRKAVREIYKDSPVIEQKNGVIKENVWVGIMDKMAGRMQGLSVKLQFPCNATAMTRGESGDAPKQKSKRAGLMFNK